MITFRPMITSYQTQTVTKATSETTPTTPPPSPTGTTANNTFCSAGFLGKLAPKCDLTLWGSRSTERNRQDAAKKGKTACFDPRQ